MNNYGLRYDKYGIAWIPIYTPLCTYLEEDRKKREYGKGLHQFVPKDYAVEEKI